MTADRALAAPTQGGTTDERLIQLQGVYPYSTPNNYLATPDGSWVFIGEGGSLAYADMRGIDVDSYLSGNGQLEQSLDDLNLIVKRAPIGRHGVVPASMVLDPDADLSDNSPMDVGPVIGIDDDDLAYVAGGSLGLWVTDVNPGATYVNQAVRVDDSGNLDNTTQFSRRFCTDVDVVTVGNVQYLVALFAKAEGSRLRFYPLQAVRNLVPGPETDAELSAVHQEVINKHPQQPGTLHPKTHGRALAVAMDVDPFLALNDTPAVDIYVAMNTNGIVRIRATDVDGNGLVVSKQWGPWFGDESVHVEDDPLTPTGLNSSGFSIGRYADVEWKDMDRHDGFGAVTRRDPPAFVELAVQDDGPGSHFLYAAVDSLGWVRFDLDDTFDPSMRIDHHEGQEVDPDDMSYGTTGVIWDQPFLRPLDLPDGPGTDGEDILFCRNVKVVQVEATGGGSRSVLVSLYSRAPWAFIAQNVGPGVQFDQDFAKVSDIGFLSVALMSSKAQVVTVHETSSIPGSGSGGQTFEGYIQVGGGDLFVPSAQTAANNGDEDVLRFVHGTGTTLSDTRPVGMLLVHQSCVSFFDLADPGQGNPVTAPYYLREPENAPGRYNFGVVPSLVDPFLLVTAQNDSGNSHAGVMQVVPTVVNPTGPDTYELRPLDATIDRRFNSGLLCEPESQWQEAGPPGSDLLLTMGRAVGSAEWEVVEDTYTSSPVVSVTAGPRWTIDSAIDRWERGASGDYWGAAADPDYDAYTTVAIGSSTHPNASSGPLHWVAGYRLRTCDGLQLIGRDKLMGDLRAAAPNGGAVDFEDPRENAGGANPWWTFQLDVDPGWSNFEDVKSNPDWTKARDWWNANDGKPYQLWANARRCFSPEFFPLKESAQGARDTWALAVACAHATCHPTIDQFSEKQGNPVHLGLPEIPASFDPSPPWDTHHDHGFALVWDVSDPWQLRADAEPTPGVPEQIPIRTDRDALMFPDPGGTAFRLDHVHVPQHDVDLVFVADFCGYVHCFDVTDLMYTTSGSGYRLPIATWEAPDSTWDERPNNVRAMAFELLSDGTILCYFGVSRVGIVSVPFLNGTTFDTTGEFKVKTPGEVWGLAITGDGDDRVLVVSDAWAGMRLYGVGDVDGE